MCCWLIFDAESAYAPAVLFFGAGGLTSEIPGFTSGVGATLLALIEKLIANMQSATSKELRPHD
ncbi:Uncharacterised protein [Corynebacterium amycolatum]|nr:Uncharacterised protein [Corynebacterium amycolatum]